MSTLAPGPASVQKPKTVVDVYKGSFRRSLEIQIRYECESLRSANGSYAPSFLECSRACTSRPASAGPELTHQTRTLFARCNGQTAVGGRGTDLAKNECEEMKRRADVNCSGIRSEGIRGRNASGLPIQGKNLIQGTISPRCVARPRVFRIALPHRVRSHD